MKTNTHVDIIMEALQDYRKWFDDDPEKLKEIDAALKSFNQGLVSDSDQSNEIEFFPITSVSKDDIIQAFDNDTHIKKIVMNMQEHEMKYLASKLADDYCEQMFWESLKTLFELKFMQPKEVENNVE